MNSTNTVSGSDIGFNIIREALDSDALYISSWLIVDNGFDDGTQDLLKSHMACLGIPGELRERPWRNLDLGDFGNARKRYARRAGNG